MDLVSFRNITRDQCNLALSDYGHKMGPYTRPNFGEERFCGLFDMNGIVLGVVASAPLVRETCAGFTRAEAIELARVAGEPAMTRVLVRLWREFVFPDHRRQWAVSYQDAVQHTGNLYRFDGWIQVGKSSSGTDPRRKGVPGRRKVIWGFSHDKVAVDARRGTLAPPASQEPPEYPTALRLDARRDP